MQIEFRYFGQLRHLADRESQTLECEPGAGLIKALAKTADGYGEQFSNILFDEDGRLRPSVMVIVNDEMLVGPPDDLQEGDAIQLIPAIAGG